MQSIKHCENLCTSRRNAGISVSKQEACCQSRTWGHLRAKHSIVRAFLSTYIYILIKLTRAANRARKLSWAYVCALVRVSLKGLLLQGLLPYFKALKVLKQCIGYFSILLSYTAFDNSKLPFYARGLILMGNDGLST